MDPIIGQIIETGFHWEMQDWAICDGRLLQVRQYQALYSLLGTYYGGDGMNTFGIPDLRPRDANNQPMQWDPHKPIKQISLLGIYPMRP